MRRTSVLLWTSMAIPILFVLSVFLASLPTRHCRTQGAGSIQNRFGPKPRRAVGILQPIADGLKLLIKEDIVPAAADQFVHFLAPVIAVIHRSCFSPVPVGTRLVPVDLNIGILFAFAVSTVSVLALFMGGGRRATSSRSLAPCARWRRSFPHEVPMVLAAVAVVMAVGSLSTLRIARAQSGGILNVTNWFVFRTLGIRWIRPVHDRRHGESARTPFDIPEAESEIIAGYHTEYSGIQIRAFPDGRISRVHCDGGNHRHDVSSVATTAPAAAPAGLAALISMFCSSSSWRSDRAQHLDPWHVAAGCASTSCWDLPGKSCWPMSIATSSRGHVALPDLPSLAWVATTFVARSLVRHPFRNWPPQRTSHPERIATPPDRHGNHLLDFSPSQCSARCLPSCFAPRPLRVVVDSVFPRHRGDITFLLRADFLGAVQSSSYVGALPC